MYVHTPKPHTHQQIDACLWNTGGGSIWHHSGQTRQCMLMHVHTHTVISDLSQCHASADSIRREPLFFFFSISSFIFSCSNSHTFASQFQSNSFSFNIHTHSGINRVIVNCTNPFHPQKHFQTHGYEDFPDLFTDGSPPFLDLTIQSGMIAKHLMQTTVWIFLVLLV